MEAARKGKIPYQSQQSGEEIGLSGEEIGLSPEGALSKVDVA